MKTITLDVYEFNDLDPAVKEKVLDNLRTEFVGLDNDWMTEDFINTLKEKGYYDARVYWSYSCCQGDGASFTAKCDLDILSKRSGIELDEDKDYGFEVVATHSHYCHEYTCRTTNGGDPHD